jgi:serine/threonine-protein kinase
VPLLSLRPDAPPELAELMSEFLAKSPDDRFQSMNEVALALAPFASPHYAHLADTQPVSRLSLSGEQPSVIESGSRRIRDRSPSALPPGRMTPAFQTTRPGASAVSGSSGSAPLPTPQSSPSSPPASLSAPPPSHHSNTIIAVVAMVLAAILAGIFMLRPRETAPVVAAAPVAPAAVTAATVEFLSDPAGASVEVDGQGRGVTPLKVALTPGSRSIRLTMSGYEPATMVVPVPSVGEVPPLPLITLRPGAPVAGAAGQGGAAVRGADRPAERPRAATGRPAADPPVVAQPSAPPPSRPRVIEERSNVKVIQ